LICHESVRLNNRLGLHLRASAELVKIASKYRSRIKVGCGPLSVNGKSLLALLTLAVSCGMNVTIIAEGDDAC
jgi:phosphocarrier protein HPr